MKTISPRWRRAVLVAAGMMAGVSAGWAQIAEAQWAQLQARGKAAPAGENSSTASDAARSAAKQKQKAHFEQLADDAEKFAQDNKSHAKEAEAKHLEAKARLAATLLDDSHGSAARALAAADGVRKDTRLPSAARLEIAVLAERAGARKFKDRAAWLEAREQSARALIAEFPTETGAQALLLEVAAHSEPAKAATLAREVAASTAPDPVKRRAEALLARQALVGRNLAEVLAGVPGAAQILAPAAGKPLVIYGWAPESAGSAVLALDLAKHAPPDAVFLGVNLSPSARDPLAAAQGLPGAQLFGGRAFDHPLVKALRLDSPQFICLADRSGKIVVAGLPGNPLEIFKGL